MRMRSVLDTPPRKNKPWLGPVTYQPQFAFRAFVEMSCGAAHFAPSSSLCVIHTLVSGTLPATMSYCRLRVKASQRRPFDAS